MSNNDIVARVENLNKRIDAHNQARERTIGTLESYTNQFNELVADYKKNFGIDISLENIEQVYQEEQLRIEKELSEKETVLQQILDGTYKSQADETKPLEITDKVEDVEPIEQSITPNTVTVEKASVVIEPEVSVKPHSVIDEEFDIESVEPIKQTINPKFVKVKNATPQLIADDTEVVDDFVEVNTDSKGEITIEDDIVNNLIFVEVPTVTSKDSSDNKFKEIKTAANFDFSGVDFGGIEI